MLPPRAPVKQPAGEGGSAQALLAHVEKLLAPCRAESFAAPSFETPQGFFNCLPHRLDGLLAPAMRPAQWLRHNPVDDCEVLQIQGRQLQRFRGNLGLLLRPPENGGTAFGRDYRINGML